MNNIYDEKINFELIFSAPFIYISKDGSFSKLICAISPEDIGNPYNGFYKFTFSNEHACTIIGVDLI